MIAGLPLETWLLLILSIGIPVAIVLKFFFTHYKRQNKTNNGEKS